MLHLRRLAALPVILAGSIAQADYFPLTLTSGSWTQDLVVENTATSFGPSVTATLDDGVTENGFTWYETGALLSPNGTGIGRSGSTFVSGASSNTAYQYQSFAGNNAILLDGGSPSATLTLGTPTALTGLSFLTSTGGGTASITVTINFADGTSSLVSAATFTSADWFGSTPIAVTAGGRVANNGAGGFSYQNNGDNPRLYEAQVLLPAVAAAHPIASISLSYGGGGHAGILAVSASANELSWTGNTNSTWDTSALNWNPNVAYTDGSTVLFEDFGFNTNINIQAAGGVKPFAVSFKNAMASYSFTGNAIAGGTSVTLNGTGSVTLGNVNTYTGGTVVNAGTLNVLGGATIGAATGSLAVNNLNVGAGSDVNVNFNSAQTIGSLAGFMATPSSGVNTAKLNLIGAASTLTVNQSTNTIFDGAITGAAGLLKTGNGTLSLRGSSTYTGGTVVNGGTLEVFNPNDDPKSALPSAQPVTVNAGATLRMGEDDGVGYYADGVSVVNVNGGTVLSKYDHHSTLPTLNLNGATVTAPGAGNVSNGVTTNFILDGTVTTTAGATASTISAPKVLLRGNTTGEGGSSEPVTFVVPRGTAPADLVVSSSLADKGMGFIKNGNGILSLTGNSTYSGGTTVNQGTLAVSGVQGSGIATSTLGTGTVSLLGGTLALMGQVAAVPGLTANFYQLGGVDQASFANLPTFQAHFAGMTPTLAGVNTTTGGKTNLNYNNNGGGGTSPFNVAGNETANYGFNGTTNYEVSLTGYVAIPAAGIYTFGTKSDDGSMLFIDGNKDAVVANNNFQGPTPKTGTYAFPAAGLYPIAVGFNQGSGGQGFEVQMALPGNFINTMTNAQVYSATSTVAPTQWYANDVSVGADSTVQVSNSLAASVGRLAIGPNTLSVSGDSGASLSFRSMSLTGNAVLNVATGTSVKSGAVSDDSLTSGLARSLTKSGNGGLLLSEAGTYTGGTTVNAGVVTLGHSGALGTGAVTLSGGTLAFTSASIAGFTGYTLNSNGLLPTLDGTNSTLSLTDEATGGQARTAFSSSQVSIANGFTASFVYMAGGNRLADGFAFVVQNSPAGPAALGGGGGALAYQGITNSGAVEFNLYTGGGNPVGTALGSGGAAPGGYTATPSVNFSNGNPIAVKIIYDNTAKTVTEILTDLASNSVYTQVFTGADLVTALGGGNLGYIGFTGATGGATATQQISNYEFNNYAQGITLSNDVTLSGGASAGFQVLPISAGGAGAAILDGHLTLGSGSTLNVTGGATATNTAYAFTVTGTTTLAGNASFSVANNGTGAGVVTLGNVDQSATAGLTKIGNGTLVLGGTATYTGGTAVTAGTLLVSGSLGTSTTATTVAGGATLGGAGTVAPRVSISGFISPGNSLAGIGKLTLSSTNTTSALDLSGGGTYLWELGSLLDNTTGVAGTDFDQVFLSGGGGNLKLGGTSKLTIGFDNGIADPNSAEPFWAANHVWTIILGGAGVTNTGSTNFSAITDASFANGFFSTAVDGTGKVTLNYIAVPEPGSCAILAGGLGLLLTRRPRRK